MNTLHDAVEHYRLSLRDKFGEETATKKAQKLKTVIFQILYPRMGNTNTSRKANYALLVQIPIHRFIETYDAGILEDIESLKVKGDKSAPIHLSVWKDFISWLSGCPDYHSQPQQLALAFLQPQLSYPKKAAKGKGLKACIPLEKPSRQYLVYGLKKSELSPNWEKNLEDLKRFCNIISPEEENRFGRERGQKYKKKGMREVSFQNYQNYLLGYLGWISKCWINAQTGYPYRLVEISVELLYDLDCIKAYLAWHQEERENSNTMLHHICHMVIKVAQWHLQQPIGICRDKAHPIIQALMTIRSQYNPKEGKRVRSSVDAIEKRMIEHSECEQIVAYLRDKAYFFERQYQEGKEKRSVMEDTWMDYFLIALLTYGGMRIREIYQMELRGKRLFYNTIDNCYWCKLFPAEHKTSGDRAYPLFPGPLQAQLTSDFSHYWNDIRPSLPHQFVFFKRGGYRANRGDPISERPSRIVKRIMFNASCELFSEKSAKGMTPHDFRRSSATWFAHYGHIEDAVIFAELHGHSVTMLLDLYAQVRQEKITEQASSAFNRTALREQFAKQQGTQQDLRTQLKRHIDAASPVALAKLSALIEQGLLS